MISKLKPKMVWSLLIAAFSALVLLSFQNCGVGFKGDLENSNLGSVDAGSLVPPTNISSAKDLDLIRNNLTGNYTLVADIDLKDFAPWQPIGSLTKPFQGIMDGNGHTISNLTGEDGLFLVVSGTIKNLKIVNANIAATKSGTGILTSWLGNDTGARGPQLVDTCSVSGTITIAKYGVTTVGGLVGQNNGNISNSTADVNISEASGLSVTNVGGLVGNSTGSIAKSSSSGQISIESATSLIGGLAGGATDISDSSSSVTVLAPQSHYVGGLSGSFEGNEEGFQRTLRNSFSTGMVTGLYSVGGLVGYLSYASVLQSYSLGTVIGTQTNIGGLIGQMKESLISQSYFKGSVQGSSGSSYVGGLIGATNGCARFTVIQDSYANASVTGGSKVGGLIGSISTSEKYAFSSYVTRVYYSGIISATGTKGGLAANSDTCAVPSTIPLNQLLSVSSAFWEQGTASTSAFGEAGDIQNLKSTGALNDWDFSNVWKIGSDGLPDLRLSKTGKPENTAASFTPRITKFYATPAGLLYGFNPGGLVIRSGDAMRWLNLTHALEIGVNTIRDVRATDSGHYYIATDRGVFVSMDHGDTFIKATTAQGLASNSIYALAIDGNENIYIYTDTGSLGVSTDHGVSFKSVDGKAGIPQAYNPSYISIAVGPSGTVYVATSSAVVMSNLGGLLNSSVMGQVEKLSFKPLIMMPSYSGQLIEDNNQNIYLLSDTLYISTDRGLHFSKINDTQGLPPLGAPPLRPWGSLTVDTGGRIYVVRYTSDQNKTTLFASNPGGLSAVSGNIANLSFSPVTNISFHNFALTGSGVIYGFSYWLTRMMVSTNSGSPFQDIPGDP